MSKALTKQAQAKLVEIHKLSSEYNEGEGKLHEDKLLSLMRKHIDEIEQLRDEGNEHYLVEIGDLLILCFELLLENQKSVDAIMYQCFDRYTRKLNQLMQEK